MNPLLNLLGLARKAGRLALGATAVERRLKGNVISLLLVASDASDNTVRRARRWAEEIPSELFVIPHDKATFGRAVGRRECALAALTDEGFAKALVAIKQE